MKIPLINKIGVAPLVLLSSCLSFATVSAGTYYVGAGGVDSAARDGSNAQPWASITYAQTRITNNAGHTIVVKNGTYYPPDNTGTTNDEIVIGNSGTSAANLVIKAENPLGATIDASNRLRGFHITGHYVRLEGFKIKNATWEGVWIGGTHHVTVTNCESFDNGKAGIYASSSDFIWIDRNIIHGCAGALNQVTSGISIHLPKNVTGNTSDTTTPRILVRWNTVYDTYQNVDFTNPTDAAGIILDDLRCAAADPDNFDLYEFPAVVEGNLVYHNGGPGVKVFSSSNVTVRNNTAFKNNRDWRTRTWRGEIQIINCDDVDVVNNIAATDFADGDTDRTPFDNLTQGNHPTYDDDNERIVFKNNLLYNYDGAATTKTNFAGAAVPTTGSPNYNKIDVSPGFIDATEDSSVPVFNFRLNGNLNSRNAGTVALGYENRDLDNNVRPKGTAIDIGCYEYQEP